MSKRYRNGFKRTLCRWTIPTPSTSYRNVRSNGNNNNNPLSPTLACINTPRHPRLTYSNNNNNNNNPKSENLNNSFCHRRDNIFTFSMSKYKFVIGSRTLARHRSFPGHSHRRRTSFHYRFSVVEQQERDEQQQQQLQLQLQQRKFSMSVIQKQKKRRAKFIFTRALPPTAPPNSSISDTKNISNGNYSKT
jgi:hypothetical protein